MSEPEVRTKFLFWGILEALGHKRVAGKLSEEVLVGAAFLRVDIPALDGSFVTQFYGAATIYALTPTGETEARAVAARLQLEPVYAYEIKQLQAASVAPLADDEEEEQVLPGQPADDEEGNEEWRP